MLVKVFISPRKVVGTCYCTYYGPKAIENGGGTVSLCKLCVYQNDELKRYEGGKNKKNMNKTNFYVDYCGPLLFLI